MLKRSIIVLGMLMVFFMGQESKAQTYATGVGLRAGVSYGLTVKHFVSDKAAIEGILHSRWGGILITGLYQVHNDIREVRGLRWFYGGGVHLGSWNSNRRTQPPWADQHFRGTTIFGIDGIIGLDYKFIDAPVNLSLDYKPAFNISNRTGFWGDEVALSIRYTF